MIYADDSGAPKDARGTADVRGRYADAVRAYAVALLMRLRKELKALAELQKYAASLLREMEHMYEADAETGLTGPEMQKRLAGNLDFAHYELAGVIWVLGWSMIVLASLSRLSAAVTGAIGVAIVALHNLLDGYAGSLAESIGSGPGAAFWKSCGFEPRYLGLQLNAGD